MDFGEGKLIAHTEYDSGLIAIPNKLDLLGTIFHQVFKQLFIIHAIIGNQVIDIIQVGFLSQDLAL